MRSAALILLLPLVFSAARAGEIDQRAEALYGRFMPPCCYTGLLRDHQSADAEEMKEEIRAFLEEGISDEEIVDHYVRLYGERILSEPPERGFNRLAVLAPILALAGGALLVASRMRRREGGKPPRSAPKPPPVAPEMDERIEREIREGM
ncbi:MAG: cytochrome c-type biogenesis protein CcmH [Candidatus Eisenbacteria bacterium]